MKAKYQWWHGLAFYAGIQFGSWALKVAARKLSGREEDRAMYPAENLPAFAPPPAVVTLLYTAATASSVCAAWEMRDPWAARSLATTVAWLALANPVGLTTAAWNRDPFWDVGPMTEPPPGWTK
jgi:hypothetical protein